CRVKNETGKLLEVDRVTSRANFNYAIIKSAQSILCIQPVTLKATYFK
ncbi:MAG: hypothetical protein ACI94O_002651, partial [Octadecabacter sp.]